MRPGEQGPSWHGEQLWPVYTGFSLGVGARSLPDHSQRWLEDKRAWETPLGEGPPGLREGLVRSAPWLVCCCLDSACCRISALLYLEPCSGERAAQIAYHPGRAGSVVLPGPESRTQHAQDAETEEEKYTRHLPTLALQLRSVGDRALELAGLHRVA